MSGSNGARRAPRLAAGLLLVALVPVTCSAPSPPRKTPPSTLTLAGAEFFAPVLRAEILAFRERYPDRDSIRVLTNGSAEGMEQLVNGEVAMSLLLRELTDLEANAAVQRDGLSAFPVAWDAIAVIVNPKSPVEQISRTELSAIYRGEITSWDALGWRRGGAIVALTPGPTVGTFAHLQQALLDGGTFDSTIYAPPTEAEVVAAVAERPDAIACVSGHFVDARVRTLRVSPALGLPYVALDRETLLTRTYPLLRSVSIATPARPVSTASDFITFVSGMDGQRILARHGYAPAAVPIEIVRTSEEAE